MGFRGFYVGKKVVRKKPKKKKKKKKTKKKLLFEKVIKRLSKGAPGWFDSTRRI